MEAPTIARIEERLRTLPPDELAVVAEFVAFLADRHRADRRLETMLATESILQRDWLRQEEDDAWADL